MMLYLADSLAPQGADPELLKATRVGLKLSRVRAGAAKLLLHVGRLGWRASLGAPRNRTLASGYSDGMLLGWQNGALACANDNALDYTAYLMDADESATRPQNALLAMDLGQPITA
ncbi:MAG: hypothetical protein V8T51_08195 [Senegalimassilia faecalis]